MIHESYDILICNCVSRIFLTELQLGTNNIVKFTRLDLKNKTGALVVLLHISNKKYI